MARTSGVFQASDRALEFGDQYAAVLSRWAALFTAASELVEANVELSRLSTASAKEFQELLAETAASPWNWFNPELMQRYMETMRPPAGPKEK